MTVDPRPVSRPPGWGDDCLSSFLEEAQSRTRKVFHQMQPAWQPVADMDARLQAFVCEYQQEHEDAAGAFIRARSSFRAAACLAFAGFQSEAFTVIRNALECALNAFALARYPDVASLWVRRSSMNGAERKKAWRQLKPSALRKRLEAENPDLAGRWEAAYNTTIDRGAHPTAEALERSRVLEDEAGFKRRVTFLYLTGDKAAITECFGAIAACGGIALDLWRAAFAEAAPLMGPSA